MKPEDEYYTEWRISFEKYFIGCIAYFKQQDELISSMYLCNSKVQIQHYGQLFFLEFGSTGSPIKPYK
jgi:hypothetical protein